MSSHIERVQSAINELKAGKMIILIDHPERENEGDLIFPAELTTAAQINFMIRYCSGIICLPLFAPQIQKLGLDFMVAPHQNTNRHGTPFSVSIEARQDVTTGVSASDRAKTILTAIKDEVSTEDIVKPGHIFPLQAKEGGVLERAGHTEGAVDIVRLAGFKPAAVLCEVMNDDGTMAKGAQLKQFADQHQLVILSIEDLIAYRLSEENNIEEAVSAQLPLEAYGSFNLTVVKEKFNGHEHIVLSKFPAATDLPLVRIHSCCITGDLFGSKRCDCQQQLHYSLKRISEEGGMLIYMNQEGRGIGLFNKIKAYSLQEQGLDTVDANLHLGLPADLRKYHIAANILKNQGILHIRLLTNNPNKVEDLLKYGMRTVTQELMPIFKNDCNEYYLETKMTKLHHLKEKIA